MKHSVVPGGSTAVILRRHMRLLMRDNSEALELRRRAKSIARLLTAELLVRLRSRLRLAQVEASQKQSQAPEG